MAGPHTWELRYPDAGATGVEIARCRIDPTDVLWMHAAPPRLAVTVLDADRQVVARSEALERAGERYPMTRLAIEGDEVRRDDRWPGDTDLGSLVVLPGGEAGTLIAWWNAENGSEWRWRVEFYNHI